MREAGHHGGDGVGDLKRHRAHGVTFWFVAAIAADGGLVRADETLMAHAVRVADTEGVSVYDAGYVAGAASTGARLVSCDLRDLVNRRLAVTPRQAVGQPDA